MPPRLVSSSLPTQSVTMSWCSQTKPPISIRISAHSKTMKKAGLKGKPASHAYVCRRASTKLSRKTYSSDLWPPSSSVPPRSSRSAPQRAQTVKSVHARRTNSKSAVLYTSTNQVFVHGKSLVGQCLLPLMTTADNGLRAHISTERRQETREFPSKESSKLRE